MINQEKITVLCVIDKEKYPITKKKIETLVEKWAIQIHKESYKKYKWPQSMTLKLSNQRNTS